MAEYLIQESTLTEIADAIRAKTGSTEAISVGDMADNIWKISSGGSLDDAAELLKYFVCQFDKETEIVILHRILYDKLYSDTGSYDITIPDKIANYNVVINSEGV